MTREEKIKQAAYSQYCNSESICFTLMCDSFKQGAKWADSHPINVWHDIDDMPKPNSWIIIQNEKEEYDTLNIKSDYIYQSWKSTCKVFRYKQWAYISSLLPKNK